MEKATAFVPAQGMQGLARYFHPHCSPREKRKETGYPTLLRCWNRLGTKSSLALKRPADQPDSSFPDLSKIARIWRDAGHPVDRLWTTSHESNPRRNNYYKKILR